LKGLALQPFMIVGDGHYEGRKSRKSVAVLSLIKEQAYSAPLRTWQP